LLTRLFLTPRKETCMISMAKKDSEKAELNLVALEIFSTYSAWEEADKEAHRNDK